MRNPESAAEFASRPANDGVVDKAEHCNYAINATAICKQLA